MARRDDKCRLGKVHNMGGDWCNCDFITRPETTNSEEPLWYRLLAVVLPCVDRSMIYDTVSLLKLHLKRLGVKEMVDL